MHPAYVARINDAQLRANAAKSEELARIWRYIADVLKELAERTERLEMDCESYQRLYARLLEEPGHTARSQPDHRNESPPEI